MPTAIGHDDPVVLAGLVDEMEITLVPISSARASGRSRAWAMISTVSSWCEPSPHPR